MYRFLFLSLLLSLPVVLSISGCDSSVVDDEAVPMDVRLTFVEPVTLSGEPAGKQATPTGMQADFTVSLQVRSEDGEDFSPSTTITVSDGGPNGRFQVLLPPGKLYTFEVQYDQTDGTAAAEGTALYFVDNGTRVVEIPVVPFGTTASTVGFAPGRAVVQSGDGTVDLTLRYYGSDVPAAGLACTIDVGGLDPALLALTGADFAEVEGQTLSAAWQWADPVTGRLDLGTLSIPRDQVLDLQLTITEGNLRRVDPDGTITPLRAVNADVSIQP